jgi:hypothetical protein
VKEKSTMSSGVPITLALLIGLLFASAAHAGFDGSKPFLCAITETVTCNEAGDCERGSAADVNLPDFVTVDVPGKMLREHGDGDRSSPITSSQTIGGELVLPGVQDHAWSAIVTPQGRFRASAAGGEGGFLLFGVCTDR